MQALLAAPRQDLTEAVVTSALTIDRAVKIRHGVDVLDSHDRPTGQKLNVIGGQVKWGYRPFDPVTAPTTQVADLRRTATLDIVGIPSIRASLARYRPWTEWLAPTGEWVRFHLGVFVTAMPTVVDDATTVRYQLALADKAYRYSSRLLTDPVVVPAGTDPVNQVKSLLTSQFGETRYNITGTTVTLAEDMVFDPGATSTTWLDVFNALLKSAGFDDLTVDENGIPTSMPLAAIAHRGVEYVYAPGAGKILTAGQSSPLLPSLPNMVRFVARSGPSLQVEGNGMVTVTNQSTGPASIDQRGDTVQLNVTVDAQDQATLAALAAVEAQRYFAGGGLSFSGKVALNPRHSDRDVVELVKPRLGLAGIWNVVAWTYPLQPISSDAGVLMDLTCEQQVVLT